MDRPDINKIRLRLLAAVYRRPESKSGNDTSEDFGLVFESMPLLLAYIEQLEEVLEQRWRPIKTCPHGGRLFIYNFRGTEFIGRVSKVDSEMVEYEDSPFYEQHKLTDLINEDAVWHPFPSCPNSEDSGGDDG